MRDPISKIEESAAALWNRLYPERAAFDKLLPDAQEEWRRFYAMALEVSGQAIGTEAQVCADIAARQSRGLAKYGVTVQDNPLPLKDWLQHAYEEALDQAIYLKRAIEEMDNAN